MFYYQFNIGDYASHTRHLTLLEDLAYRRLLDLYYLHEKPLDNSIECVARQIGMRDHVDSVEMVLTEFFECLPPDGDIHGWINKRADEEIATYRNFSEAGKRGANKRWGGVKNSPPIATPCPPYSPPIAPLIANKNQEPITNNQEPSSKHTEIYSEQSASACLTAGAVCKRIIELGIPPQSCNPGHPDLAALLAAGASMPEFDGAARMCVEKGKGFPYLLGIVKGQREQAAALVLHKGAMPEADNFADKNYGEGVMSL